MALTRAKLIADGVIDVDNLAAGHSITTSNIGEGSNLYYTDGRVASYLTTNSYATESFVTTGYLPLSGGTVSGNLTVTGSLTGTLATASQTNITSVGTLSSLAVSGSIVTGSSAITAIGNTKVSVFDSVSTSLVIGNSQNFVNIYSGSTVGDPTSLFSNVGFKFAIASDASATGFSEKMRIDSSGNVGIGTSSPTAKLHVVGSAQVTDQFAQGVNIADKVANYGSEFRSPGASAQIFFGRSLNNTGSGAIGADGNHTFAVWNVPSFSRPFVVNQDSNVGIGTIFPAQKLHVAGGNIKVDNGYGIDFSATGGAAGATSSLLDDYEEGTWPVQLHNVTATYVTSETYGWYTKIGNIVHFIAVIRTSSINQTAVNFGISLPFTAHSSPQYFPPVSVFIEQGFNPSGDVGNIQMLVVQGSASTDTYVVSNSTGTNYTPLLYTNVSDASKIRVQGTYQI